MRELKRVVTRALFGPDLPQEFTVGMLDPQNEIGVWLCSEHGRRDVTFLHSTACSAPFIFCIRLAGEEKNLSSKLWLEYADHRSGTVLGRIGLALASDLSGPEGGLYFFAPTSVRNDCLPLLQRTSHFLLHAYQARIRAKTPDMSMTLLEERAANASFIRPHPIGIGSVDDVAGGNIFILNLMGELGDGRFGFALRNVRWPARLVERTGRMALSSVPAEEGQAAFLLTKTHKVEQVNWEEIPFPLQRSPQFNIRVPGFALRVRELEVESVRKMGSHNFFIARVVTDDVRTVGEELHAVHGFFQAWRLRGRHEDLRRALAQDTVNKQAFKQTLKRG